MLFLQSKNSLTYTSLCGIHVILHSSLTSRIIASVALSSPSSPPPGSVHHSSPVLGCLWCIKEVHCFYLKLWLLLLLEGTYMHTPFLLSPYHGIKILIYINSSNILKPIILNHSLHICFIQPVL